MGAHTCQPTTWQAKECQEFKASLAYLVKACLKKPERERETEATAMPLRPHSDQGLVWAVSLSRLGRAPKDARTSSLLCSTQSA